MFQLGKALRKQPWRALCLSTALAGVMFVVATATAGTLLDSAAANRGAKKLSVVGGGSFSVSGSGGPFKEIGSATITIPSRQTGLLLVRFAGESVCNFGAAGARCDLRIVLADDGVDSDFEEWVFDTDDSGDNYTESHAVQKAFGPLAPGTYTVTADGRVIGSSSTTFSLGDWTLTVELWRVT